MFTLYRRHMRAAVSENNLSSQVSDTPCQRYKSHPREGRTKACLVTLNQSFTEQWHERKQNKVPIVWICKDESCCTWAEVLDRVVFEVCRGAVRAGRVLRSSAQRVGGHTVTQSPPLRPQHQRLCLQQETNKQKKPQHFTTLNIRFLTCCLHQLQNVLKKSNIKTFHLKHLICFYVLLWIIAQYPSLLRLGFVFPCDILIQL